MMDKCVEYGEYYGYPSCCIKEFNDFLSQWLPEEDDAKRVQIKDAKKLNFQVSNKTGFVPCDVHTQQILQHKISLEDLIQNRKCPGKFPKRT
jgi:hypothetical protein